MSDIVKRLRDLDTATCEDAADEIERLRAENASLASWQCEFTDGKTGLVYGQGGTTFCIMAKKMEQNLGQIGQLSEGLDLLLEATSKQAAEIKRLRAALRFWCNAYKSGQHEPLVVAYESTVAKFPALEERT